MSKKERNKTDTRLGVESMAKREIKREGELPPQGVMLYYIFPAKFLLHEKSKTQNQRNSHFGLLRLINMMEYFVLSDMLWERERKKNKDFVESSPRCSSQRGSCVHSNIA